jgi:MFS transporter, FSR family, fosmidomycin resistance protein
LREPVGSELMPAAEESGAAAEAFAAGGVEMLGEQGASAGGDEKPGGRVAAAPAFRPAARRALFAFSVGHLCVDLSSGAISALIPFLVVERHYTYGAVGTFVLASSVAGGLMQPVFGHFGDRMGARWLMAFGLVLAGIGIGSVGLLGSYAGVLVAVAVASIGVAAYHPEGARWARLSAGTRVVSGMSVFSVGGGVGFGLSPLLVTAVVAPLGLSGTPLLAVPPLVAAVAVSIVVRRLGAREFTPVHGRATAALRHPDEWWPFARLAVMYGMASWVVSGIVAYVPLFLIDERGAGPGAANAVTTVFLCAAAAGTLIGGRFADRFGRRLVLIVPPFLLIPAIALVPSLGYWAIMALAALLGVLVNFALSTAIVLGQEYLPDRLGLAAGVIVGASVGMGGIGAAILGQLGDAWGPSAVIYVTAALPIAIIVPAVSLPRPAALAPESRWSLRSARG